MRVSALIRLIFLALVLATAACSRTKKGDPVETLPVDEVYALAKKSLQNNNLDRAIKTYERLIARFPFGAYTEQSQLELAYAQYKDHKEEEAYSSVNRFIKTYPTHKHIDYAYYLRGLINFDRSAGLLERYVTRDQARRDQGFSLQSFEDFGELIKRYPDSRYVPDSRQRMIYLRNNMARAEIGIALFYLRHRAYVAAANRAEKIVEVYQRTPQAGDALAVMAEAYGKLGQDKLSADARRVLELNYPEHPYLKGDFPPKRHKWKRLIPFTDRG
ncbi:outer membrane protein assembly factor BamD [Tahibacter amnicola]|uniref:Outer membrane protein assembly factor BamD n=1 Tax=Tahibacter amnicola TaxID=2976241 RepID=A0ABY6BCB5_9GAMM|nr:outer membrane protein assembly factor BamD [Tahibacter amnicola]UXI67684.1 outer membrane protein assembly factor BamD [Tahibacter amnicola]